MQSLWLNEDAVCVFCSVISSRALFFIWAFPVGDVYKLIINQPVRGLYFGIYGLIFVRLGYFFGF
jgi:hypothetical protein